jgi:oxalate---CoA ligase
MAMIITDLLTIGTPAAPAITAPGRPPCSFETLRDQVAHAAATLRSAGLGAGDRVGIILPNGPELATAFLAVASTCGAAPLNPALTTQDLEFCLADFGVRALVLAADDQGAARQVAAAAGIPVLDVTIPAGAAAGCFEWHWSGGLAPAFVRPDTSATTADSVALILHTSGTTARPKIVPLRHRNLVASAKHICATLLLGPADCCLNVMPLFHIHGLVACLLAPLSAGGSVCCSAGFNALRFAADLDSSGATWYSAVPTMHQTIVARVSRHADEMRARGLRFIRSSSAALPPRVLHELESVFGAPVVEAYGMTEAAHQMACNPLPPGTRKPGTVGPAAGPDVAIMDDEGRLLPPGVPGEIVIKGPNVFDGYENRPEANAASFTNGWFRTGDQGVLDAEGYVAITSRLKEIINRGGEKISPREIDEVLLEHEAVRQAVAFPIPHPSLGEAVAAAVVLHDGATVTERELITFVASRLTAFKVPSLVRILDDIPRGATGKIRRLEMASLLGLT